MTSRTALITGASQRIGAAIARDLHSQQMNVVIHYNQSKKAAEALALELNTVRSNSTSLVQGDLLEIDHYEGIVDEAFAFKNRLDVLINNASSFFPTPFGEITPQDWHKLIGVNTQAPLFLSQYAARHLSNSEGCIVNLTDIYAERAMPDHIVYSTAKAGLLMLTKALARELAPRVRVNGVAPGAILWPDKLDQEKKKLIIEQTSLKRAGEVKDVVKAVAFLINDASYISGQIVTIDGGRMLY